jgi:hypothetical protein
MLALVMLLAAAGGGCHSILGPSSLDGNWSVIDTPHFAMHVRPSSYAEQNASRLAEVLEDQYAFTVSALDIRYTGRVSLFLFASAADAGESSERSGTAYPDTEAARAIVSPPLETTFGLVSHESNHVIQLNGLGPSGTHFMIEGLASAVMSERYHPGGTSYLYPWTAANDARIPPLSELVDDERWGKIDSQVAYQSSASFLAYLLDAGGPARLKQVWAASSSQFAARFQEAYGRSLDQAEREWRAFCATYRPR